MWIEIREDQVTEVLQASQSQWGVLLRNEAVSPFSISMSNSATSLIIEQHFSPTTFHISSWKKIFRHFQSVPFSCYLEFILVLAGGGDRVGANERRQAIWHTLCRCRHITIPCQGIFFVNEADFFDFLFDYTFSEMTDLPAI